MFRNVPGCSMFLVLSTPYFAGIIYVCFVYFAATAQVWINLHRQHVFFTVMLWKRSQVPRSLVNIRKRTKKRPWRKRQSRRLRFSFHKYFTTSFYLFLFFNNFFSLSFFSIRFLPTTFTHTPRPVTHTHDPRPLPTTHDPRHLATLVGSQ